MMGTVLVYAPPVEDDGYNAKDAASYVSVYRQRDNSRTASYLTREETVSLIEALQASVADFDQIVENRKPKAPEGVTRMREIDGGWPAGVGDWYLCQDGKWSCGGVTEPGSRTFEEMLTEWGPLAPVTKQVEIQDAPAPIWPENIVVVKDRDDDEWHLRSDGKWSINGRANTGLSFSSLDGIEADYGPLVPLRIKVTTEVVGDRIEKPAA